MRIPSRRPSRHLKPQASSRINPSVLGARASGIPSQPHAGLDRGPDLESSKCTYHAYRSSLQLAVGSRGGGFSLSLRGPIARRVLSLFFFFFFPPLPCGEPETMNLGLQFFLSGTCATTVQKKDQKVPEAAQRAHARQIPTLAASPRESFTEGWACWVQTPLGDFVSTLPPP